ncbi:MAG: glutamate mutase L [Clostridioides sp.]|jgi:uncharacterized protein (TIGR01319 family)|nr:glutamate mutase L [Clostridioides sp.]
MKIYLAADVGSTFTKLTAVDIEGKKIIASSKSFTTIESNVMEGYNDALNEIKKQSGNIKIEKSISSSSAAGGLKMISCGLVPDITAKASRLAAASAGAKILKTYSYELTKDEQEEIYKLDPEIILLSGGIDGGNKDVILKNAKTLADIDRKFAVIVAGNKCAGIDAKEIIEKSGKEVIVTENVMPQFNKLNIMPAKKAIRDLFIENIIHAKGLDELQSLMDFEILPTPLAVFEAMELLSKGTNKKIGFGEIMAFDVGGATTDVYSMAEGNPRQANVYMQGMIEPFAKRSIEGDIGVRYSITSLVEESGIDNICEKARVEREKVEEWVNICVKNPETLPTGVYKDIDRTMASEAIRISAQRHCGFTEKTYSLTGEILLQTGKDLTGVKYVIGSGGSVINSDDPREVLKNAIYSISDLNSLKPLNPKILLDKKNIFAAMGLISKFEPEVALEIMEKEFIEI